MRSALLLLLLGVTLGALPAWAMGPFYENPPEVVEGMTALAAGKPQEALDAFDAAKARLGSRPELEHNRALALAQLGQREDAVAIFRELAEDPALPRALRAKSAYHLGNVHAAGSARKEAIAAYRQALTLQPGDADARHNLEVLLRNVPPKQESPADGGQDTPDGGEPEETGEDGGQDGGSDHGDEGDAGEDGGEGEQPQEEGDSQDGGDEGDEDGQDGGEDGEQEGESPEDGGEEPGSGDADEGEDEDGGADGGEEAGDAGASSETDPDANPDGGQADGGEGDAGEDAGEDTSADGDGDEGDAGSDGGDGLPEDAGSEQESGSGADALEQAEGEQEGVSAKEAESMLDAMKQDERNLQLWRFQGRKRPRDANQKDW